MTPRRRIIFVKLGSIIATLILAFKSRVFADGGTFEDESCLNSQITSLRNLGLYDNASLIVTPNAYKVSKIYSVKPTSGVGDMTFTRAGTKLVRNAAGVWVQIAANIPPLHYPVGDGCPSWLHDSSRTNLYLHSETTTGKIIINYTATNDSGLTPYNNNNKAVKLAVGVDGSSVRHRYVQQISVIAGTQYTFSYYIKKLQQKWIQLLYLASGGTFSANCFANFDVELGVVGNIGSDATARISDDGNGYWRCEVTATCILSGTESFEVIATNNLNSGRYPAFQSLAATDVCLLWGGQVEVGPTASSPIITEASAVTRVFDSSYVSGISSLIAQPEGCLYFSTRVQQKTSTGGWLFRVDDGTENNRIGFFSNSGTGDLSVGISRAGVSETLITVANFLNTYNGGLAKMALNYKDGQFTLSINGSVVATSTNSGAIPAMSQLRFNSSSIGTLVANAQYDTAALFTSNLTNDELSALTTL